MRVHIVAQRINADRILSRMVRYLCVRCGWTASERPDSGAELNYFFNYLLWRQKAHGWRETPIAGFFTHRDEANELKARYWDECAEGLDLRTVCAEKYAALLRPHGPTALVRPPVELDRFRPRPREKTGRPIVGVSGYTYGDNRKGEELVAALATSRLAPLVQLRASGRGWPIPTKSYPWEAMPRFFQSLDVLLVPSMWEGIHMPTLEALACGVKVVLPEGLGILDEIAAVPGVHRYRRGNVEDMARAVEAAAFGPEADRELLRAQAMLYSVENWCADHEAAFEEMMNDAPEVESDLPPWRGAAGVYMVAFGKPSRSCAARAVASLHRHLPGVPVCVCSDRRLGPEDVFVLLEDGDVGGRKAKLMVDELAPAGWRYVLYLDADTEAVGDLGFLFQVLEDGWELVLSKDMAKYDTVRMMLRPDNREEAEATWRELGTDQALQYNGGMMAFRRCDRTRAFFRRWRREWERWGKRDQGALLRALHQQPLRLYVLGNQWNASTRYPLPAGELALLHHNTEARRWSGLIRGRLDSDEAWALAGGWNGRQRD